MRKKYYDYEVNEIIRTNRKEAAEEAQQIGFELGKQAQAEQYALLERPLSKQAEHKLQCPSCQTTINLPCVNYSIAKPQRKSNG